VSNAAPQSTPVPSAGRFGFGRRSLRPGGIGAPATRRLGLALSFLIAALTLLALGAAPASATKSHFFLEDFGSAAQPSFSVPTAVAIDQSTGDVLVVDPEARTLSRYKPDGTPDDFSALGTNVIDGVGPEDETPQGGLEFPFADFGRQRAVQVAVDNSGTATDGNIYLATGNFGGEHVVDIFASSGKYLGQLTEYKEGEDASGPSALFAERACGVAVAPDGTVYTGDSGGYVHKYVPSANPPVNSDNVANFSYPLACTLAVGAGTTAGFIFANTIVANGGNEQLSKLDAVTGQVKYLIAEDVSTVAVDPATGDVYAAKYAADVDPDGGFAHYDASGTSSAVTVADVPPLISGNFVADAGIAVRASTGKVYVSEGAYPKLRVFGPFQTAADVGTLSALEASATRARLRGTVNPDGVAITACEFEYGTVESGTFSGSVPCEESIPTDTETHTVSALATDLEPGVEYQYRLVAKNADQTSTSAARTFRLLSRVFTGGPTGVRTDAATLNGAVRPEDEAVTQCEFEFGVDTSYGESVPCSPGAASIPTDFGAHIVSAQISGLEEFSVYHYRLRFATGVGTFTGKDEVFRTLGPSGLPDNRRYEQVSPVDKNHSDVRPDASASVASIAGNRLVFRSPGSFAGSPTAQESGVEYLATRGAGGWSTESITLPGGQLSGVSGYQAFTPDLAKGVIDWPEDTQIGPHDPNAVRGFNLYLHNAADRSFTLLNGTEASIGTWAVGQVAWGSSDFSHLAIVSHNPLTPEAAGLECDASTEVGHTTPCAYEWDEGTLRMASIVNGEPVEGTVGARGYAGGCSAEHAMSGDGSRLFFTTKGQLYAREDGTTTTPISESERTLPGGLSGNFVNYQNAEAAHGDRVLFTTNNSLVDEDTDEANDLYLYDYSKPAGERLTLISKDEDPNAPAGASVDVVFESCGGVMGASEDLRRVYFVADNQVVAGEPEEEGPKLFLWDDTGASPTVTYLGKLEAGDYKAWMGTPTSGSGFSRNARVSSQGRYLVFLSTAKLSEFENEGRREIYLYDAVTHTMQCASCSPDAVPAEGPIGFEEEVTALGGHLVNHLSTNVTDSGQVFFQTTRGLIPADANGQSDVYEYEHGRLSLISSGEGPEGSYFLDATPSGSDVFFTTKDRLVGWDKDQNTDAYDAREGGGFPEPPLAPPGCNGDACQPAPNPPNDATPASSSFEGSGNVSEPRRSRCAKGKVRRHGRCVKRRKHRRHARHRRTANLSHG
jgi:hypothetical protein